MTPGGARPLCGRCQVAPTPCLVTVRPQWTPTTLHAAPSQTAPGAASLSPICAQQVPLDRGPTHPQDHRAPDADTMLLLGLPSPWALGSMEPLPGQGLPGDQPGPHWDRGLLVTQQGLALQTDAQV